MIRTDTAVQGFVVTLVAGILAATSVPLGLVFLVLGLVADDQETFKLIGLILIVVGAVETTVALVWRRRAKARDEAESAARTSRPGDHGLATGLGDRRRLRADGPRQLRAGSALGRVAMMQHDRVAVRVLEVRHVADAGVDRVAREGDPARFQRRARGGDVLDLQRERRRVR